MLLGQVEVEPLMEQPGPLSTSGVDSDEERGCCTSRIFVSLPEQPWAVVALVLVAFLLNAKRFKGSMAIKMKQT